MQSLFTAHHVFFQNIKDDTQLSFNPLSLSSTGLCFGLHDVVVDLRGGCLVVTTLEVSGACVFIITLTELLYCFTSSLRPLLGDSVESQFS